MKLKKIFCLALAGIMLMPLLVACGGDDVTPNGDETPKDPVDSDPIDSDPIDSDPIDSDPVDSDPVDSDPVDSDPVDSDPVDTDPEGDDPVDDQPSEELREPLPKDKTYSILFIGNSYTKRNNMTADIFAPMAKAAGYDVKVTAILNGGHTLLGFADPNDTYGAQVARELDAANV